MSDEPVVAHSAPDLVIPDTSAGFAALMGAPNAGKSTLTNALVGQKVSIVSQKVQTTRFPVRGIAIHKTAQIVLVDTPGVFKPTRRLDRAMVAAAWAGAGDADSLVHVVDAAVAARSAAGAKLSSGDARTSEDVERVIAGLRETGRKAILALNKVDLIAPEHLLDTSRTLFDEGVYSDVVMVSAATGSGLERLRDLLAEAMTPGPWLYPEDQVADIPQMLMAAEITREKVFLRLHEELPYQATVETESWQGRKDGSVRVDQVLYLARENHKAMAIGKGGATLKWISMESRKELQELLQRQVHLFIQVKVRENWQNERARFSAIGLEFEA
ncbi:MAG: GTPase Era [Hyphomonadaceae bacterium]|jgi:GTP-binding protein Era|nr:GTPase Era [Hyphomonadaceae bacterium]